MTCTVYQDDHEAECLGNYGMWRTDGDCFARDRQPILGCQIGTKVEWFFSHYETATSAESVFAAQSCADQLGLVLL